MSNSYSIYQLKQGDDTFLYGWRPYDSLVEHSLTVQHENYDLVYTGKLLPGKEPKGTTLEGLFIKFNTEHPEDFNGHSLSVSDIVVLRCGGDVSAHYVDSIGFKEVPEFLEGAPAKEAKQHKDRSAPDRGAR